jgi:hypothetical protein
LRVGGASTAVINETIAVAKDFLDAELAKCDMWNGADGFIRSVFQNEGNFQQSKKHGASREVILKFLGGNWKAHQIQSDLERLKDKVVQTEDREDYGEHERAKSMNGGGSGLDN